ncbi:hypothetical protein AcV5_007441 [Taiwanofungus camphoratus]|nr:hypothetical protein AcV7_005809 [Antrodia cinnamomea]KAI0926732.1 hypothetical protein AcV5_007441 [Antrodia cinnamomea]
MGDLGDIDASQKTNAKSKRKKGKTSRSPSSSVAESESEEEGWGKAKSAYYSSNAPQLESDDEEANELEEQEARRLQTRARDAMADDDFGLGDDIEGAPEPDDILAEAPAPIVQPLPQDKASLLRHLEKTNPEALALARDWDDVACKLTQAESKLAKLETENPDALSLGMVHLHHQALLTYVTTLAFYLHLRASKKYAQRPELLRSHPILSRLLTLKQSLSTLEDLGFDTSNEDDELSDEDQDDMTEDAEQLWSVDKKKGLELGELEDLLREADLVMSTDKPGNVKAKSKRKSRATASEEPPKKKHKTGKASADSKAIIPEFDLIEPDLTHVPRSSSKSRPDASFADVYGEATSLHATDAADKNARKKSLRFHTARIESTSARRQAARSGAMGGDDDIPYRERRKEKELRLVREAAKSRGQGGDDLDDADPEPRRVDKKRARESDEGSEDGTSDDGYYQLVNRQSKEKREKKKVEYEAAKAAARPDINESIDGPRALTRAILKNKGLTPHRGKSVRNPRVKKRQKFEKAKKKVSSQKAIYKGGDSGRYEGEKTGITRVVKSVRL